MAARWAWCSISISSVTTISGWEVFSTSMRHPPTGPQSVLNGTEPTDPYSGYLAWAYPTNRMLQRMPLAKYITVSISRGQELRRRHDAQVFPGSLRGGCVSRIRSDHLAGSFAFSIMSRPKNARLMCHSGTKKSKRPKWEYCTPSWAWASSSAVHSDTGSPQRREDSRHFHGAVENYLCGLWLCNSRSGSLVLLGCPR